jgi:hypothetical protein
MKKKWVPHVGGGGGDKLGQNCPFSWVEDGKEERKS